MPCAGTARAFGPNGYDAVCAIAPRPTGAATVVEDSDDDDEGGAGAAPGNAAERAPLLWALSARSSAPGEHVNGKDSGSNVSLLSAHVPTASSNAQVAPVGSAGSLEEWKVR